MKVVKHLRGKLHDPLSSIIENQFIDSTVKTILPTFCSTQEPLATLTQALNKRNFPIFPYLLGCTTVHTKALIQNAIYVSLDVKYLH